MTAAAAPTVTRPSDTARGWLRQAAPAALGTWLLARVLVGVSFVVADLIAPSVDLPDGRRHFTEGLLSWDGSFYRAIAEVGYDRASDETARFFPLYPTIARVVSPLFAGREDIALVVVANVAALAALFVLYRLVTAMDLGHEVAQRAVVALGLFPAGMALVFAYAEAPFLWCLLVAALMLVGDRPLAATLPLLAVGMLRPTGVLVSVAVAVLMFEQLRGRRPAATDAVPGSVASVGSGGTVGSGGSVGSPRWWLRWLGALAAPAVGLAATLGWIEVATGRGMAPFEIQRQLRAGFREPITRLFAVFVEVGTGNFRNVYNLAFALCLVAVAAVVVRRRFSAAWSAYLVVGLLVALAANNIDSIGRYGLLLAPALPVGLALLADRRGLQVAGAVLSCVGFVAFTTLTILGLVVP